MKEMITYGKFICKEKFNPLSANRQSLYRNKPSGGLWGSPVKSGWGWKDWCKSEGYNVSSLEIYTKWKIKNPKQILIIDSKEDFIQAMDDYGINFRGHWYLDFIKIMKSGYTGCMLTERGNRECHPMYEIEYKDSYIDLNSWDCESIVVWDWRSIIITETGRIFD